MQKNTDCYDVSEFHANPNTSKNMKEIASGIVNELSMKGYCKVRFNRVTQQDLDETTKVTKSLFEIPTELKKKLELKRESQRVDMYGFRTKREEGANDLEYFISGNYQSLNGLSPQTFEELPYPFLEKINTYREKMNSLTRCVFKAIALGLDKPETFFNEMNLNGWADFKAIHYPSSKMGEVNVRKKPHTDYSALTILYTDQPGLEFFSKDYKIEEVETHGGEFVINCGNMLQAITEKQLYSPFHQVVTKGEYDGRYSLVYFVNLNNTAKIPFTQKKCWDYYFEMLETNENELKKDKSSK